MKDKRVKNCTFVLYPETGFELSHLDEYLRISGYKAAISPLHSPDDTDKKEHYHIIIKLASPRLLSSLSEEFASVCAGKCTKCFSVGHLSALTRYLTHMDDMDKQQFNEKPTLYGGYEYDKYVFVKYADSDLCEIIQKIGKYVYDEKVVTFGELICLATADSDYALVDYCINHAYAVNLIVQHSFKSKRRDVNKGE